MDSSLLTEFQYAYNSSKERQTNNGVTFNLSFSEYLEVITRNPKKMAKMERSYDRWLKAGAKGHYFSGYVLSWASPAAYRTKVMDKTTANWCNVNESKEICKMKAGDKHTELSKKKISDKKSGIMLSDEHKEKIKKALTGSVQSVEAVAKRKATWAAKRLQKGNT